MMREPCAVILTIDDDGRAAEMELVFASRWLAEWFVYQLPYLMTAGQWTQVRAAILSPLVHLRESHKSTCSSKL